MDSLAHTSEKLEKLDILVQTEKLRVALEIAFNSGLQCIIDDVKNTVIDFRLNSH